jgi:hypothetical protein
MAELDPVTALIVACRQKDEEVVVNFVAAGALSFNKF